MAKDTGRGWGTLAALVAALGMCAMPTHGQNVSCERLAQLVGHLFSNYTYRL